VSGCSIDVIDAGREGGSSLVWMAENKVHCLHAHGVSRRSVGPFEGMIIPTYEW
jgi:hypothetical protein